MSSHTITVWESTGSGFKAVTLSLTTIIALLLFLSLAKWTQKAFKALNMVSQLLYMSISSKHQVLQNV